VASYFFYICDSLLLFVNRGPLDKKDNMEVDMKGGHSHTWREINKTHTNEALQYVVIP
jgi:hypothetical protein